jgi:NitT/TauT family transport system permease protein
MVFLIAAEWSASDIGFGYRLRMQSRLLNMNVVYSYLIMLGIFGWLADYGLVRLRRWLCPWFGE